jgi:uncharacterized membrane protein
MPLKRTEHWATREFHLFLKARATMKFAWGTNDCALFAADGVQSFTGTDLAAEFRGKYSTEAGALATIKSVTGGATIADAAAWCATKHGLVELVHPLMAQRGDLVICTDAGRDISGLVHLSGRHIVAVGADGLLRLPITNVVRAWRV